MAYNFRNVLVNLNEEIRKSGGGGEIPAIKLDVSQLKVSMASVSAQVADIMQTLQNLNPSTTEKCIGKWVDGTTDLYEKWFYFSTLTYDQENSIPSGLINENIIELSGYCDLVRSGAKYHIPLNYCVKEDDRFSGYYDYTNHAVGLWILSNFDTITGYVKLIYTKNTVQTKKGGKK